ncbi:hypothetical protein JOQ06_028797, partial [Pogonophryne albipinna]
MVEEDRGMEGGGENIEGRGGRALSFASQIRACLRWVAGSRPPNKLQARGHSTEREGWMEREGACYGYVCQ